ncbi:MAG: hypothetical protein K2J04_11710 [Lachnospiraceae bacterium]|nr:hypothetical protein [Lachnospiraceae bacterium]
MIYAFKDPKTLFGCMMTVCGEMKYHGTESSRYMYGAEQEITVWKAERRWGSAG